MCRLVQLCSQHDMTFLHGLPGEDLEYLGDALLVLDHAELDEQARQAVLVVLLS